MKQFKAVRKDTYIVYLEAENKEEAQKKLDEESRHLNGGSYCGSDFTELEEDE